VRAAHQVAHAVEAALVAALPGLEVTIHVEPVDEEESWESEEMQKLGEQVPGPHDHGGSQT
jgi:divalent metal cation (Fe/Co/Zn/Cd) transporter